MKSFCIYCGSELTEGAKFCKKCGKPVNEPEQEIKTEESVRNPEVRIATSEFATSHSSESFEKLYRLTYPKVYSYVSMLTHGNKETAEDVIQSGYLICYDKIDQLQKPENFTAWAKNICYHEYLHAIEKTSHEQLLDDTQSADEETDFFDNIQDEKIEVPEKAAENGELKRLIFKTLDSLPENQRAAVISFYFDDKKISAIAADMNAPENTIKTYLSRAKKNLCSVMSSFADSNGLKLVPVALIPFMAAVFSEKVKACEPAAAQCASSYTKLSAKLWPDAAGAASAAKAAVSVKLIVAVIAAGCAAVVSSGFGAKAYKDMKAQESIEADESMAAAEADDNDKMQATDNAAGSTSSTQSASTTTATTAETTTTTTTTTTTESFGSWQEAYRQELTDNILSVDSEKDWWHFDIGYIDDDDIPELFVLAPPDQGTCSSYILTFRNGKTVPVSGFSVFPDQDNGDEDVYDNGGSAFWGPFEYVPKQGMAKTELDFGTSYEEWYSKLENGVLKDVEHTGILTRADGSKVYYVGSRGDAYFPDGSDDSYDYSNPCIVDEATYNAVEDEYKSPDYVSGDFDKGYAVTEANMDKYLK